MFSAVKRIDQRDVIEKWAKGADYKYLLTYTRVLLHLIFFFEETAADGLFDLPKC